MYYLVLYCSSDLCAAYSDYFAALTQILCDPCITDESGCSRRFLLPAAQQDTMTALLIHHPLPPFLT